MPKTPKTALQAAMVRVALNPRLLADAWHPWPYLLRIVRNEALKITQKKRADQALSVMIEPGRKMHSNEADSRQFVRQALQSCRRARPKSSCSRLGRNDVRRRIGRGPGRVAEHRCQSLSLCVGKNSRRIFSPSRMRKRSGMRNGRSRIEEQLLLAADMPVLSSGLARACPDGGLSKRAAAVRMVAVRSARPVCSSACLGLTAWHRPLLQVRSALAGTGGRCGRDFEDSYSGQPQLLNSLPPLWVGVNCCWRPPATKWRMVEAEMHSRREGFRHIQASF